MTRAVVDANVPIVANGRHEGHHPDCQESCVDILRAIMRGGTVYIDDGGEILLEYARYLNHSGQPGFGDAFFRFVIQNQGNRRRVRIVELPILTETGEYADFPADARLATFDRADRKYAACARKARRPVLNAVDTDWLKDRVALNENDIVIIFVCGLLPARWFA
jgi:hypothetical protein